MASAAIPIGLGLASFLGGLGGDKTRQNQRTRSMPIFDSRSMALRDRLLMQANRRLSGGGAFSAARNVTNDRLQTIGGAGAAASQGLAARLAAMGIRGPAAGMAQGNLASGVFSEQVGATNQEPLLARQFGQEDQDSIMALINQGKGTESTGSGESIAGGGISGGFADMGQMLGWLASQGLLSGLGGGGTGRV